MHNMLSSQGERGPPFLGSQLEAIKRRAYEQHNADLRDEVGEDDGEVQSLEDDEESDARDEDSKSEGGDDSSEDDDREGSAMRELRLSMVSQAAAQQAFNL